MIISIHKATTSATSALMYSTKKIDKGDACIVSYANFDAEKSDVVVSLEKEFERLDWLNIRTKSVGFHASINPTKQELGKFDINQLARDYMQHMGYGNQPYIVVQHNDTGRVHYHIVSHRVGYDGKRINRDYEKYRNREFNVKINKLLSQVEKQDDNANQPTRQTMPVDIAPPDRFDARKGKVHRQVRDIFNYASGYNYANEFELEKILLDYGVSLIQRDGYWIAAGVVTGNRTTKAIKVDGDRIKPVISKSIGYGARQKIRNLALIALQSSNSARHAQRIMAKQNLGVQFLFNDNGQIYGAYYIDHSNKLIVKASDISKEVSGVAWQEVNAGRWQEYSQCLSSLKPDKDTAREIPHYCLSDQLLDMFIYTDHQAEATARRDLAYSRRRGGYRRYI